LILRKIIKIVATRSQILTLKCTKIDFGWGSAQTPLGSLQRSHRPLAGFKGPTSKGKGREGRGGEGRERKGGGARPLCLLVLTILATGLNMAGGQGQSDQAIKLFQITPYVNFFIFLYYCVLYK